MSEERGNGRKRDEEKRGRERRERRGKGSVEWRTDVQND